MEQQSLGPRGTYNLVREADDTQRDKCECNRSDDDQCYKEI